MDKLLDKMKEFLKMDSELPFGEFREYYQTVMDYLQEKYEGMNQEELVQALYILQIVAGNASTRAQRKSDVKKKFMKMAEKASFWCKAINYRLEKEGLSQEQINAALENINPEM